MLDRYEGALSIIADDTLSTDWSGHIHRHQAYYSTAGYRSGDYRVDLALHPARFAELLALFQPGQELFGLLLYFEGIHWPDDQAPLSEVEQTYWDDVNYPRVALTSFLLRWKPAGKPAIETFEWPKGRQ